MRRRNQGDGGALRASERENAENTIPSSGNPQNTQSQTSPDGATLVFTLLEEQPEVMGTWDNLDLPTKLDILDVTAEEVIASSYMISFQGYARALSESRRDDGTTPTDLDHSVLHYHRTLHTKEEVETVENLLNMQELMNSLRNTFSKAMDSQGLISLPPGEFPSSTPTAHFLLESVFRAFAHRLRAWYTFVKTRNTVYYAMIINLLAGRLFELKNWSYVLMSYLLMTLAWHNHWFLDRYIWAPLFHGIDNLVSLRAIDAYLPTPGLSQVFARPNKDQPEPQTPNLFVRILSFMSRIFHDPDPLRQLHRTELLCLPLLIAGIDRAYASVLHQQSPNADLPALTGNSWSLTPFIISIVVMLMLEAERAASGSVEGSACAWTFEAALARVNSFFALASRASQLEARAQNEQNEQNDNHEALKKAMKTKADSLLIGPFAKSSGTFITYQAVVLMLCSARSLAMLIIRLYVMYKAFYVDWSTFLMVMWLIWPNFTTAFVGGSVTVMSIPIMLTSVAREKVLPRGIPLLASVVFAPFIVYCFFAYRTSDVSLLWTLLRLAFYILLLAFVLPSALSQVGMSVMFGAGAIMASSTGGRLAILVTLPVVGLTQLPRFFAIFLYKLHQGRREGGMSTSQEAVQPFWLKLALLGLQLLHLNPDSTLDLVESSE